VRQPEKAKAFNEIEQAFVTGQALSELAQEYSVSRECDLSARARAQSDRYTPANVRAALERIN